MAMMDMIRHLQARVGTMVTRGVISLVNDSLKTQGLQNELQADDAADGVEHFQPFGLSFHPTKDSEVIVLAVGGAADNLVALVAQDRDVRPTDIAEGEGGMYTPSGWKVFCGNDDFVNLAEKLGAALIARADRTDAAIQNIQDAITNAGTGSMDGGAAFKAAIVAAFQPPNTGCDKVRGT